MKTEYRVTKTKTSENSGQGEDEDFLKLWDTLKPGFLPHDVSVHTVF